MSKNKILITGAAGFIGSHLTEKLLNLGYKVPKDIAIIGFTDGPIFKYVKPSITSIDQHGEYVGKLSAKLLIKRIENDQNEDFIHEVVPTSLIKRNST